METTRSLVVLLFVIDPISILAHPHCTTVGKLLKSLVVIHSQKTLLKVAWPVFQPCYEYLRLAKKITTVSSLHKVLFKIDWWFNENLCIILLVMNISTYITDWSHLIWLKSIFYCPFNLHPEKWFERYSVKSTLFFSELQKNLRFSRIWFLFFSDLPYETQLFLRWPL